MAMLKEWARTYDETVLSRAILLRPPANDKDEVNLKDMLKSHYSVKPLEDCAKVFLKRLRHFAVVYPTERGQNVTLFCLLEAILIRFNVGAGRGIPGLTLPDLTIAKGLTEDIFLRGGSVERPLGQYNIPDLPQNTTWVKWLDIVNAAMPDLPPRSDFVTEEQHNDACGLLEQERWEAWVNGVENAWGFWIFDCIPLHLREPNFQHDEDRIRLLDYMGHDGKGFDTDGRVEKDYRRPMDWASSFTYQLWILSIMSPNAVEVAFEWMTEVVKERVKAKPHGKPWMLLGDLKQTNRLLAKDLDRTKAQDKEQETTDVDTETE